MRASFPSWRLRPLPRAHRRAIDETVLRQARRSGFDTLAASAAGARERCTTAARQACGLGADAVLPPGDAALVLGAASHALDYDDVCMLATCHPSAPVLAALLALLPSAPERRLDEVLSAYLLGTETLLRLGEWLGFRHYALGFHATDTLGVVGAAGACAHLLGLPGSQTHAALAIAASAAGGLRANFGTDTKPLHVGFAAQAAVRAVLLARAGADASDDVWGPLGFYQAFTGGASATPLPWTGEQEWAIASPGFEHKRFPSCYLTHRLIAGVLRLRARQPQAAAAPVAIDIEMPHNGLAPLKYPQPHTGLQGKFSGPYCAATAWIDGRVELASFSDAAVQRPAVRAQMERVHLHERAAAGESLDSAPVRVRIEGAGVSDAITVDWAPGSHADPMTREELLRKWNDCAAHGRVGLEPAQALAVLDAPGDGSAHDVLLPLRHALLAVA